MSQPLSHPDQELVSGLAYLVKYAPHDRGKVGDLDLSDPSVLDEELAERVAADSRAPLRA
jgi:hypothetical protein